MPAGATENCDAVLVAVPWPAVRGAGSDHDQRAPAACYNGAPQHPFTVVSPAGAGHRSLPPGPKKALAALPLQRKICVELR